MSAAKSFGLMLLPVRKLCRIGGPRDRMPAT